MESIGIGRKTKRWEVRRDRVRPNFEAMPATARRVLFIKAPPWLPWCCAAPASGGQNVDGLRGHLNCPPCAFSGSNPPKDGFREVSMYTLVRGCYNTLKNQDAEGRSAGSRSSRRLHRSHASTSDGLGWVSCNCHNMALLRCRLAKRHFTQLLLTSCKYCLNLNAT